MRKARGFTLVEVMMALSVVTAVVLALATATAAFLHIVGVGDKRASAIQLADSRIDEIQLDPNYPTLETTYAGTESSFATLPGFARTTVIVQTGGPGQPLDYKKITVTVDGPGLPNPISRTITVAAP